jgi:CheY-like chemotaxis protein
VPAEDLSAPVILVVDDEAGVNRLVTRYLRHLGYRVLEVRSGDEALTVVRRRQPRINVILSDVATAGLDGVALATQVLSRCPGPSVILMTGRLPEEIERVNVNGQIVQVLGKPLNLDRLQNLLWVTLEGFPDAEIAPVHWSGRAIVQEV